MSESLYDLTKRVSEVTKMHKFETAFRYALVFIDGYNIINSDEAKIDLVDFIIQLAVHDRRFKEGVPKRKIFLPNDKFKEVGTVYIGKPECKKIKDDGDCALLYLFDEGTF